MEENNMKNIRSINISDIVWNRIPVNNKSAFTEYAVLDAIEKFRNKE